MDKSQAYLVPPWSYLAEFSSIAWSTDEDALVYDDYETFILRQPLAQFIDGFGAKRELIHFGYILHLLDIFLNERTHRPSICNVLRHLMKQPGVSYRNAGLFAAHLVPSVPATGTRTLSNEVYERLSNPLLTLFSPAPVSGQIDTTSMTETFSHIELPTLSPMEFENLACTELKRFNESDIQHWLRSGTGPIRNAAHLPVMQSNSWEENLLGRERLRGVAPFLTPLLSALSLPPRRLVHDSLPQGGYADVTNRGRIDALLPTQFALDQDDFIRRFAEQELLYFLREDPVVIPEADLLIILDQGIRTWGNSRLRLTAAALALISQSQVQGRNVLLATSNSFHQLHEVSDLTAKDLAELLEASDLTAHPSVALSMLAAETVDRMCDIALLTHPRNLIEPAVALANQTFSSTNRLFALTVDEESNAVWGQIKYGQLTKAQRFHIKPVERPTSKATKEQSIGQAARRLAWTGPVERCASPFKVPQRYNVLDVDFDTEDQWMFVLDTARRVTAHSMDGTDSHYLLPRLFHNQFSPVLHGLVGVSDGFVAFGLRTTNLAHLAYYRMGTQEVNSTQCSGFPFTNDIKNEIIGNYIANAHLMILARKDASDAISYNLEENVSQLMSNKVTIEDSLAHAPWRKSTRGPWEQYLFHSYSGEFSIRDMGLDVKVLPMSDGKPAHQYEKLLEVQKGCDTLCLLMEHPRNNSNRLHVYQLPGFQRIAEWNDVSYFKLSPSGRYLARRVHPLCIQVNDLHSNNRLVLRTSSGNRVRIRRMLASPGWLYVQYASRNSNYFIDWRSEELQCTYRQTHPNDSEQPPQHSTVVKILGFSETSDSKITQCHVTSEHRIMADELGQIWVYDLHENLICVFLLDQSDLAGWMPDGTIFGPHRLIGVTPTPHGMRLFAQALQASAGRQP